jgi:hypothetical protein
VRERPRQYRLRWLLFAQTDRSAFHDNRPANVSTWRKAAIEGHQALISLPYVGWTQLKLPHDGLDRPSGKKQSTISA